MEEGAPFLRSMHDGRKLTLLLPALLPSSHQAADADCPISIGRRVSQVQRQFGPIYGIPPAAFEGSFDALLEDDEVFRVGELECKVLHLPGHTPDHIGIVVGDTVFAGDSIFLCVLPAPLPTLPGRP